MPVGPFRVDNNGPVCALAPAARATRGTTSAGVGGGGGVEQYPADDTRWWRTSSQQAPAALVGGGVSATHQQQQQRVAMSSSSSSGGGRQLPAEEASGGAGSSCSTVTVLVASKNVVKVDAVATTFRRLFPSTTVDVRSVSVPSDVSAQPFSNEETLRGARNRVRNAVGVAEAADFVVAIEGGVEWCSFAEEPQLMCFAWAVVLSKDVEGKARTAAFLLPPPLAELIAGEFVFFGLAAILTPACLAAWLPARLGLLAVDLICSRGVVVVEMIDDGKSDKLCVFPWCGGGGEGGMEMGEADNKLFGRTNSKSTNGTVGVLTKDHITRQTYYEHAMTMALIPFINPELFSSPSVPVLPVGVVASFDQ